MLIALAFAHFSSELLLKEQMIIPVKKTLNNAGHIDAKLIDFSEICQKKSSEIGCFLLIVSRRSFPPEISREIGRFFREFWLFSCENPAKSADFSSNLPLKIPRNFAFFSAKSQKPSSIYFIAGKCPSWAPFWIFWIHTCVNRHQMWDPSFLSCCSYPSCSDNE